MPSYLVTGTSRGLGVEFIAQLSANKENTVFALLRTPSSYLEELKTRGLNFHTLYADIVDYAALAAAAMEVSKITGGTLDLLICNAAKMHDKDNRRLLHQFEGEEAKLQENLTSFFTVNVVGTINTLNAFLPLLAASTAPIKKAVIITSKVGDLSYTVETQNSFAPGYGISKAALNLAIAKYSCVPEYREKNVLFIGISPGLVKTTLPSEEMSQEQIDAMFDQITQRARKYRPNFEGVTSVESSTRRILATAEKAGFEMNGRSFGQDGELLSD